MKRALSYLSFFTVALLLLECAPTVQYDLIINNALIYDGLGGPPYQGSIAVKDGRIAAVGELSGRSTGDVEIDAQQQAVAPGFINVMSWATESLIEDGRSQSGIRQGVTLEVMGESMSMGPLNDWMKQEMKEGQGDLEYEVAWTTLGEYLEYLVERGISCNVASFVGTGTVRVHVLGFESRPPNAEETEQMKVLVRQAMEEGAMGVGSALIYVPDSYNRTEDLIELCKAASEYNGMYISHIRSEGNRFIESLNEFLAIAREADLPAEIYHLKAAGRNNWHKMDEAIQIVEEARAAGLHITADMYTYIAGATGLDAAMPPWVQEGGYKKWAERLQDPKVRARVASEMEQDTDEWENLYLAAGPEKTLLVGFNNEKLKPLTGKSLAEIAKERGTTPAETAMDLVVEDGSRVGVVYFLMHEDNLKKQVKQPWVSFGSDAPSMAPEGNFLKSNPHPRAYGNVARLLAKYVREEKVITVEEAVRRLTSLPADNLKIRERGVLNEGYWADIVVFDPDTVQDHATFDKPHQYATGVTHVFVNGAQVLKDGEHTGATPGVVVRGPGWSGWKQ